MTSFSLLLTCLVKTLSRLQPKVTLEFAPYKLKNLALWPALIRRLYIGHLAIKIDFFIAIYAVKVLGWNFCFQKNLPMGK